MCFFFSSRRRHTRCSRDWSSDVCSSDLCPGASSFGKYRPAQGADLVRTAHVRLPNPASVLRSEERRVGKECRARLSTEPSTTIPSKLDRLWREYRWSAEWRM